MTTTEQHFVEQLMATIAEMTENEDLTVDDVDSSFRELGVDSLMALEMVVKLERQFGLRLNEEEIRRLATPTALVEMARQKALF